MTYLVQLRSRPDEALFTNEKERALFLDSLGEAAVSGQVKVYAFALLETSALIFLRSGPVSLSKVVHRAQAGYFNRLRSETSRAKPLLQDRHRAILVEEGDLFHRVIQRVHIAPVIGGHWSNESEARKWGEVSTNRWTSFSIYTGKLETPEWFDRDGVLARFAHYHPRKPEEGFYRFVIEGVKKNSDDVLDQVVAMSLLGSEEFRERYYEGAKGRRRLHSEKSGTKEAASIAFSKLCHLVADEFETDVSELLKPRSRHPARKFLVELASKYALDEDGVKGLGRRLQVSGSALAHLRNAFRKQLEEEKGGAELLEKLEKLYLMQ